MQNQDWRQTTGTKATSIDGYQRQKQSGFCATHFLIALIVKDFQEKTKPLFILCDFHYTSKKQACRNLALS